MSHEMGHAVYTAEEQIVGKRHAVFQSETMAVWDCHEDGSKVWGYFGAAFQLPCLGVEIRTIPQSVHEGLIAENLVVKRRFISQSEGENICGGGRCTVSTIKLSNSRVRC